MIKKAAAEADKLVSPATTGKTLKHQNFQINVTDQAVIAVCYWLLTAMTCLGLCDCDASYHWCELAVVSKTK